MQWQCRVVVVEIDVRDSVTLSLLRVSLPKGIMSGVRRTVAQPAATSPTVVRGRTSASLAPSPSPTTTDSSVGTGAVATGVGVGITLVVLAVAAVTVVIVLLVCYAVRR